MSFNAVYIDKILNILQCAEAFIEHPIHFNFFTFPTFLLNSFQSH